MLLSAGVIALASVVTRHLLAEYELFRESFRIYHDVEPVSVVHCDSASYERVHAMPSTIAVPVVVASSRPLSQRSEEYRAIVRHKIDAVADAWRLLSPDAVLYLDVDIVAIAPFMALLEAFPAPLTLSPHYWTYDLERHIDDCGYYNAGVILVRDRRFCDWWRTAFDGRPELFADQRCLNDAPAVFDTGHFPATWNVGYWRRRGRRDVPRANEDTVMLHAHILAPPRPENEFEVGQKHFVAAALAMLDRRGTPRDIRLLEAIRVASAAAEQEQRGKAITQNYRQTWRAASSCFA